MHIAAQQVPPPGIAPLSERVLVQLTRPIGHVVTAAHMAWGAANELLTLNGYRLLAAKVRNPVLTELLGRIAGGTALRVLLPPAEWRLTSSRLARVALPAMLRRSWTPVGIGDGYKRPDEFSCLLGYLATGSAGERAVRTMDRTYATLPGFAGLRIYTRAAQASMA